MKQFKTISPIGTGDATAVPVRVVRAAVPFYTRVLGFVVMSEDERAAVLERDDVRIGLVSRADHDWATAGSFYISVVDVETLRREFTGAGAKPGAIHIQEHDGNKYRLFFVREIDTLETHDGYCFCFGQPA